MDGDGPPRGAQQFGGIAATENGHELQSVWTSVWTRATGCLLDRLQVVERNGRLGAIRTRDLPLRRRLLYPSELRAHIADGGRRPNGCVQDLCPPRLFYRSRQRAMLCAASAGRRGIRGLAGSNSWNEPRGASRIWHSAFIARREPRPARSPRRTAGLPRPGRRSRAPCVCRDAAGA